ncbi:MAG TPA: class I SAM-dependent methyltransferase [Terracidiphilus sp.]|nr:class I SAM-dependent methyltransferase [Terracidiphilus sp.]
MSEFRYAASELDLFAAVQNWKSYWSSRIRPFVTGDVLEVGAGIGANTSFLDRNVHGRWVCLEPDPLLVAQLRVNLPQARTRRGYEVVCGSLQNVEPGQMFDSIVYIDVLEHIENDREELENAMKLLRVGGRIIVLSPAHQRLFTPFDAAIGHFRRYDRSMLRNISPPGLPVEQMWYLDCLGLLLSAANLMFLRQSMPTKAQLAFWDRCAVPSSRVLDKLLLYSLGKSIVAIWKKPS